MSLFFFFNDTATTEIYTLSLHDALPIYLAACAARGIAVGNTPGVLTDATADLTIALLLAAARRLPEGMAEVRSEEHTSELQSRQYLVCRLLLEKKKNLTSTPLPFRNSPL